MKTTKRKKTTSRKKVKTAISPKRKKKLTTKNKKGNRLVFDKKNWIAEDGTKFRTMGEMLKYDAKLEAAKKRKQLADKKKDLLALELEKKVKIKLKKQDKKNESKWKKQRAERGFADCDLWSLDYYFLTTYAKAIEALTKIKKGWQPKLGYKIEKGRLIRARKDITFKDEINVLKYLSKNLKKLSDFLFLEDVNEKKVYSREFWKKRQSKINKLHKETMALFGDILYSLWD